MGPRLKTRWLIIKISIFKVKQNMKAKAIFYYFSGESF